MGCGSSVARGSAPSVVKEIVVQSPAPSPPHTAESDPNASSGAPTGAYPPVPLPQRAVSLQFLKDFAKQIEDEIGEEQFLGLSTQDVVNDFIIPRTQDLNCAYTDLPSVPRAHVGQLTYFISHAWPTPFSETLRILTNYLAEAVPEETFLWLDVFAINHNEGMASDKLVVLQECVKVSQGMLVCLGRGPAARVVLVRSGVQDSDAAYHGKDGHSLAAAVHAPAHEHQPAA